MWGVHESDKISWSNAVVRVANDWWRAVSRSGPRVGDVRGVEQRRRSVTRRVVDEGGARSCGSAPWLPSRAVSGRCAQRKSVMGVIGERGVCGAVGRHPALPAVKRVGGGGQFSRRIGPSGTWCGAHRVEWLVDGASVVGMFRRLKPGSDSRRTRLPSRVTASARRLPPIDRPNTPCDRPWRCGCGRSATCRSVGRERTTHPARDCAKQPRRPDAPGAPSIR